MPAIVVVVGALLVPDTPSSLVLRGDPDRARAALQRIRGADADVGDEFKDIVLAVEEARRNDEGAFERLRGKGYRHYLVMMVAIPTFFDLTGMIVITVFSPVLFRTVGFDSQKAILGSVILSLVNLFAVVVSTFVVDRAGRRFLFLAGGVAMMLCQVTLTHRTRHPHKLSRACTSSLPYTCLLIGHLRWRWRGYWRIISGGTTRRRWRGTTPRGCWC